MSSSVKKSSTGDDTGGGSSSGGGDVGGVCGRKNDRNLRTAHERKSKRVSLLRFRGERRESKGRRNLPASAISGGGSGGGGFDGGGRWLCVCFKPTPTLDSSGESQTSDPNSLELNKSEFLKGLMEKNDFWAKECNTHLDVQSVSSSDDEEFL